MVGDRCATSMWGRPSQFSTRPSFPRASACRTCGPAPLASATAHSHRWTPSRVLGTLHSYHCDHVCIWLPARALHTKHAGRPTSELETLPLVLLASPSRSVTCTRMPYCAPNSLSVSAVPAACKHRDVPDIGVGDSDCLARACRCSGVQCSSSAKSHTILPDLP